MAIVENIDYVFCPAATHIGVAGVGKGCLVGTKSLLLGLPVRIEEGVWNSHFTTVTYSIAGASPPDAIAAVAAADETTLDSFEAILRSLGDSAGAVLVDLSQIKRLKLRAGLCTKGVYWSERESGPGWKGYGLGNKELCEHWIAFYRDLPISV